MTEIREFPTPVVLSVVTGRLLCDMREIYKILNWMTGESLFTHQLPRVCREAAPVIVAIHPSLSEAIADEAACTTANFAEWRDKWVSRYGASLAVPKLSAEQHERVDSLSELAEKVSPDQIVVVTP